MGSTDFTGHSLTQTIRADIGYGAWTRGGHYSCLMSLSLDVSGDRLDDAVGFHLFQDVRGRRCQHALQGREIVYVGRDRDVVASVVGDVFGDVSAGARFDGSSTFRLASSHRSMSCTAWAMTTLGISTPFVRLVAVEPCDRTTPSTEA